MESSTGHLAPCSIVVAVAGSNQIPSCSVHGIKGNRVLHFRFGTLTMQMCC